MFKNVINELFSLKSNLKEKTISDLNALNNLNEILNYYASQVSNDLDLEVLTCSKELKKLKDITNKAKIIENDLANLEKANEELLKNILMVE